MMGVIDESELFAERAWTHIRFKAKDSAQVLFASLVPSSSCHSGNFFKLHVAEEGACRQMIVQPDEETVAPETRKARRWDVSTTIVSEQSGCMPSSPSSFPRDLSRERMVGHRLRIDRVAHRVL